MKSAVMCGNSDSETLTELGTTNEWIISWGLLMFLMVTFTFWNPRSQPLFTPTLCMPGEDVRKEMRHWETLPLEACLSPEWSLGWWHAAYSSLQTVRACITTPIGSVTMGSAVIVVLSPHFAHVYDIVNVSAADFSANACADANAKRCCAFAS